jgi:hypothetical protein
VLERERERERLDRERGNWRVENVLHYFCEMPLETYPGPGATGVRTRGTRKILFHGIHVISVSGEGYCRVSFSWTAYARVRIATYLSSVLR